MQEAPTAEKAIGKTGSKHGIASQALIVISSHIGLNIVFIFILSLGFYSIEQWVSYRDSSTIIGFITYGCLIGLLFVSL